MNNKEIHSALEWRYAVKRFDPSKKISEADWQTLKASLLLSPSSFGMQPFRFLVIDNPELRAKLKEVSWNQGQITDAARLVVFASKEKIAHEDIDRNVKRVAEVRQMEVAQLDGLKAMLTNNLVNGLPPEKAIHWTQRQAYIAMGFLLETAALLKIDATPMEGLNPEAYDQILALKGTGWRTVAVVALGYRHGEDGYQHAKKSRLPESELIEYR